MIVVLVSRLLAVCHHFGQLLSELSSLQKSPRRHKVSNVVGQHPECVVALPPGKGIEDFRAHCSILKPCPKACEENIACVLFPLWEMRTDL